MNPGDPPSGRSVRERLRVALRLDRAIRLVWGIAPGLTLANGLLVTIQGVIPLALLYLMKQIIDSTTTAMAAADKETAFRAVLVWILIAGLVTIFRSLAQSLSTLTAEAQGLEVADAVSDMLHRKSMEVDLAYYENPRYYEAMHRAQQEAPRRPLQIVNGLIDIGRSGLSLAGILALLFAFNWWIGLVLFLAAFPSALVRLKFSRRMFDFQVDHTPMERRSWYYHFLLTGQPFAKEMRLFNLGDEIRSRFRGLRTRIRSQRLALSRSRAHWDLAARVVSSLTLFASLAFIAWTAVTGVITLGALVMYYQGFQRGIGFLQSVLGGLSGLYESNLFLSHFHEFMAIEPAIVIPSRPQRVPRHMRRGLRFENVAFRYPGNSRHVLEGLDFHLDTGEVVALVGANGCGKTTLVKLLCRLYDPDEGRISVDGKDLRSLDPREWRRKVGVTFQDYIHYQMTLEENIRMGDVAGRKGMDAVKRAATMAGADSLAAKLPGGYHTHLGVWFQEGEELSAGEWQKIALARTFFRDAEIVVLDEPSSALDPESESELFLRFRKLVRNKSAILISHRFSTVRMADRICVLEDGRIIEEGSHAELMARKGRYHHLYYLQARNYQED